MLIRLTPVAPHPTILFSISFQNLPESLPSPLSWASQLNSLVIDDLEVPKVQHCLDKAACLPSLLEDVSFDLSTLTVSCRFVDGSTEEWPLIDIGCLKALESVISDVNASALEAEREKGREREQQERDRLYELMPQPPSPAKPKGHKKQRSLLMSIVASLVPSSPQRALGSASRRTPSPPPTPRLSLSSLTTSSTSPRTLRRRARATLVDAFRRYILSELAPRLPPGGYYTWIAQSMFRRATTRMTELIQRAGGRIPEPERVRMQWYEPIVERPAPGPAEEEDNVSEDTDTDGSSVHTPSSSHFNTMNSAYNVPIECSYQPEPGKNHSYPSQSACSPHNAFNPEEMEEYSTYSILTHRLRQLLILTQSQHAHMENEHRQREAMLEIRGRRRAWLNKSLLGGVRGGNMDIGLAMPFRSSPLTQSPLTADEYDLVIECTQRLEVAVEYEDQISSSFERTNLGDAHLFPVAEEDLQLEMGLDLEDGGLCAEGLEVGGRGLRVEIDRPHYRPRIRTSSMYRYRIDGCEPGQVSPPLQLTPASLLCQPLTKPPVDMGLRPPGYPDPDGMYDAAKEEFTLAMDLPLRRMQHGRQRKGLVGLGMGLGVGDDGWVDEPGLRQRLVVDCC